MTNNLCCELDPMMTCEECGGKVCDACWPRFYEFHEDVGTRTERIVNGKMIYEPRRCKASDKIVEHDDRIGLDLFPLFIFRHYDQAPSEEDRSKVK